MALLFDFNNGGASVSSAISGGTVTNTAGGVTFTVSTTNAGANHHIFFGNSGQPTFPFSLTDFTTDDAFTLTFKSTANTANATISATASNPFLIQLGSTISGTWKLSLQTTGGATNHVVNLISAMAGGLVNLGTQKINGIIFTSSNDPAQAILTMNAFYGKALNCFTKGTQISMAEGTKLVEDIAKGDMVKTADGRDVAVTWVGKQRVETKLARPREVNPIRISAGALGNGLPKNNLEVSPDHALALDGVLINAGPLVNGTTIYQLEKMPLDGFTYYHIETEDHELLVAEGVAAESFIDYAGRDSFENGDEATGHIAEMPLPRISSARLVPDEIKKRLAGKTIAA